MKNIVALFILSLSISLTACRKNKAAAPAPEKAILKFPDRNAACTSGKVISDTQSSITFVWNPSANTSNYEMAIKHLLTGQTSKFTSTTNEITLSLTRDTPYSWYVISKSDNSALTAQSDTWKFYNSGIATVSHPPYPAEALAPTYGQAVSANLSTIELSWSGSDADNDILTYDVYFGTTNTPTVLKNNIPNTFLKNIQVTSGTTYYWKVLSKDSKGNSSESAVFQFKVN